MNINILLADFAQGGLGKKLNALGLGWTRTGPPLGNLSIILFVDMDDGELGSPHEIKVKLVNRNGETVVDPKGHEIEAEAEIEVHLDGELEIPGVQIVALNVAPGLPLEPDLYTWEVTSPSSPDAIWTCQFQVFDLSAEGVAAGVTQA